MLYIARHGQTVMNNMGLIQGSLDSPLTSLGKLQAKKLGQYFENNFLDFVYTSPQGRALETLTHSKIEVTCPSARFLSDFDLRERAHGEWEGKVYSLLNKEYNMEEYEQNKFDYTKYGVESYRQLLVRVSTFCDRILHNWKEEEVLVLAHQSTNRALLASIIPWLSIEEAPRQRNDEIICVKHDYSYSLVSVL